MEIKRDILESLRAWKVSPRRKPLVLQGARQVGKSWALKKFGEECFADVAYFNFDTMPALKEDFKRTKHPAEIIKILQMTIGKPILPESTLVILDEIQECNDALNSLKYFCEEMREYAVVCAGSLLGVALNRSGASFPVGKVDFLWLGSLSFGEYLRALDAPLYASYLLVDGTMPVPEDLHLRLLESYKVFLALGGMPEVVSTYAENGSWQEVQKLQDTLLKSYTLDFAKHIHNKDIPRVYQVWNNLQDQLAREDRKFRYADIQRGARAREYESAIEWLRLAGLVNKVCCVETPRLPLSAYQKNGSFKLYLNDTGLLCRKFNLLPNTVIQGSRLFVEFKGILAENYILQSLVRQFGDHHYYWTSGNTAEVEFLLQMDNRVIPIEVKSDHNIRSKSLSVYRSRYMPHLSIRFSTLNLHRDGDLLSIPLYLADKLEEMIIAR